MKTLISLILVSILFAPIAAKADAIADGYHSVLSCFDIDNTNDSPDHVFFLIGGDPLPGAVVLGESECPSFYKFSTGKFAAAKTEKMESLSSSYMNESELNNVNSFLLFSDTELRISESSVPDANPLTEIHYKYHIDSLTDDSFVVRLLGAEYKYQDESTEWVSAEQNGSVPAPSKTGMLSRMSTIILAVLGFLLLAFAAFKMRTKSVS